MGKFAVAIINGTQARFFTLDSAATSEYESSPNLIEHEGLSDSTKELRGQELWANTKTGRNRSPNSQTHSYDDHRQKHELEFEKRFAHKISSVMLDLIQTNQARHLILVAEPQILGMMREAITDSSFKNLNIQQVAKDLCHLKTKEIHDYLANKELLPPYQRVYPLQS